MLNGNQRFNKFCEWAFAVVGILISEADKARWNCAALGGVFDEYVSDWGVECDCAQRDGDRIP